MQHVLTKMFAAGGVRLSKTYTPDSVSAYPNARNITSNTAVVKGEDWAVQLAAEIKEVGEHGGAILKGSFVHDLSAESRKGLTDKKNRNSLLVLDIDGWNWADGFVDWPKPITKKTFQKAVDAVIDRLPEFLQKSDYVAHASASMGTKKGIYLHLFFMLSSPLEPAKQRLFLYYLNMTIPEFRNQCKLTNSQCALSYVVDPALADNSRIIYVADPEFKGMDDPFEPNARLLTRKLEDGTRYVPPREIQRCVKGANPKEMQQGFLNTLRTAQSLPPRHMSRASLTGPDGSKTMAVTNPDKLTFTEVSHDDNYVRYNVNGGDSNAYYVEKSDPRVVRNFKGEMPFLFQVANKEAYQEHMVRHPLKEGQAAFETDEALPFPFYDPTTDTYHVGFRNVITGYLEGQCLPVSKGNNHILLENHGVEVPEVWPAARLIFDPTRDEPIELNSPTINNYVVAPLLREGPFIPEKFLGLKRGNVLPRFQELCPVISKLLDSMCGSGREEQAYYLNWLAHIIQTKQPTQTMWMFHGTFGTGKGLFHDHVIKPIFTDKYYVKIGKETLADRFNGWMDGKLIYVVDELRIHRKKDANLVDKLKSLATEETMEIRHMRQTAKMVRNFTNGTLLSNADDAFPIDSDDRRINVAPRQNLTLYRRYPELEKEIMKGMEDEYPRFASLLHGMQIDAQAVRTPLQNSAKGDMEEVTRTEVDAFCDAIADGDFDYFLPVLDTTVLLSMEARHGEIMQRSKSLLLGVLDQFREGRDRYKVVAAAYRTEELFWLFKAAGGCMERPHMLTKHFKIHRIGANGRHRRRKWQVENGESEGVIVGQQMKWRTSSTPEEMKELRRMYLKGVIDDGE